MKTNKKISFLLICAMVLNLLCTFTAFAGATSYTIPANQAETEITLGTGGDLQIKPGSYVGDGAGQTGANLYLVATDAKKEAYADYTINAEKAGLYKLSLYNTEGYKSLIQVWANEGSSIDTTDDYKAYIKNESTSAVKDYINPGTSTVYLGVGENTLRILITYNANYTNSMYIKKLKFETVNSTTAVEYGAGKCIQSGSSDGSIKNGNRNSLDVVAGATTPYVVNVANAGKYKVSVSTTSASLSEFTAQVGNDGASVKNVLTATTGYHDIGVLELAEGTNKINLTNSGSNPVTINKVKFEYTTGEDVGGDDEGGETENNIVVAADGITFIGANPTSSKINNLQAVGTGEANLIWVIARYNDAGTKLEQCKFVDVIVTATASGVKVKQFKNNDWTAVQELSDFNADNSSKSVDASGVRKSFLLNATDYSPVCPCAVFGQ